MLLWGDQQPTLAQLAGRWLSGEEQATPVDLGVVDLTPAEPEICCLLNCSSWWILSQDCPLFLFSSSLYSSWAKVSGFSPHMLEVHALAKSGPASFKRPSFGCCFPYFQICLQVLKGWSVLGLTTDASVGLSDSY